jgi:hypothetical protein
MAGRPRARLWLPLMDNEYPIDLKKVIETVETAEVMTIRFAVLPQRLLLDMRFNEQEGPLIKVVPRARSVEERFRSMKQLRPRFRVPERIAGVWWPRSVDALVRAGVWDRVCQRMIDSGYKQLALECEQVLAELRELERQEIRSAVRGVGYDTVWPR